MAILIALFIAVPILEIWVIVQVGQWIGFLPTLALLLLGAVLGVLLLRHQGGGAWRRFNQALAERRFPGREVADGLMIAVGATLLLAPGFVSDFFGLLLLIPPTRAIARRLLRGYVTRRFVLVGVGGRGGFGGFGGGPGPGSGTGGPGRPGGPRQGDEFGPGPASRDYDYEGTAEEIDDDDPQLPR